jgi:hypothetical protein
MNVNNCYVDAYAFVGGLPDIDLHTVAQMRCLNRDWASVVGPEMEARMVRFIAEDFKEIMLPDGTYLALRGDTVHIKNTLLDLAKLARLIKTLKEISKGQPMPDLAWVFRTTFFRDASNHNSKSMVADTRAFMLDVLKCTSLIGKNKLARCLWEYLYMSFSIISDATFPEYKNRYRALSKLEHCQTLRLFLNFDKDVLPSILQFHFLELLTNIEQTWRSVLLAN